MWQDQNCQQNEALKSQTPRSQWTGHPDEKSESDGLRHLHVIKLCGEGCIGSDNQWIPKYGRQTHVSKQMGIASWERMLVEQLMPQLVKLSQGSRTKRIYGRRCQGKENSPDNGKGSPESKEGQMSIMKKVIDEKGYQIQSLRTINQWPGKKKWHLRVHPSQSGERQ
jgi:hypothetical protein